MTEKGIVWLLPLVALLIGCGGKPTAQELVEVDSLLAVEKNDSAYQIIAAYDPASFENEADRAYYNLLMTHAAVVSYHWPESAADRQLLLSGQSVHAPRGLAKVDRDTETG